MSRLAFVFASLLSFTGCTKKDNDAYCQGHSGDTANCPDGGGSNTGPACKTSSDCKSSDLSVCDTTQNGGTCVQCTTDDKDACSPDALACIADSCQACTKDSDCPVADGAAGVCLPAGTCVAEANIVFVVATGGSGMSGQCGTSAMPCDLNTALTIAEGSTTRDVLKLGLGTYMSTGNNFPINVDIASKLIIDGRLATFHRNGSNGAIFTINSGKGMTLLGGTIEMAASNGGGNAGDGDGLVCNNGGAFTAYDTTFQNNDSSGVDATGCDLKLSAVYIHDNSKAGTSGFPGINVSGGKIELSRSRITSQKGGGLNLGNNASFSIVDNVFWNNGDTNGNIGGVSLNTNTANNRFDFNTVTKNQSKATLIAGVSATLGGTFVASNNIIYGNIGSDMQVSGGPFAYSDIGPTAVTGGSDGQHNVSGDPMFKNPASDFQLNATSPVKGKADPAADLTGLAATDINGTPRVAPADPGAYVVPAQ